MLALLALHALLLAACCMLLLDARVKRRARSWGWRWQCAALFSIDGAWASDVSSALALLAQRALLLVACCLVVRSPGRQDCLLSRSLIVCRSAGLPSLLRCHGLLVDFRGRARHAARTLGWPHQDCSWHWLDRSSRHPLHNTHAESRRKLVERWHRGHGVDQCRRG